MEQNTQTYIVLKELAGNPPPHLNTIQQMLAPHAELLESMWTAVWIMTAIVLAIKLWHEYKAQKNESGN